MSHQTLLIKRQGSVAHVVLNRPDVRNAFNEISIAELTEAFRELGSDAGVRVIVLAARGPRHRRTAACGSRREAAAGSRAIG